MRKALGESGRATIVSDGKDLVLDRDAFAVDVPLSRLFEAPTVAGLAVAVAQKRAESLSPEELDRLLTQLESLAEEETRELLEADPSTVRSADPSR